MPFYTFIIISYELNKISIDRYWYFSMDFIFIFIPGNVIQKFSALRQTQKIVDIVCLYLVLKSFLRKVYKQCRTGPYFIKYIRERGKFSIKLSGILNKCNKTHNKRNEKEGRRSKLFFWQYHIYQYWRWAVNIMPLVSHVKFNRPRAFLIECIDF